MEQPQRNGAEQEQRQDVCDGGDKGIGEHGGVDMDGLGKDGHAAADDLGDDDRQGDGHGDGRRVVQRVVEAEDQPVDQLELGKAGDADGGGDEHGDAQFLPDDLYYVARAYLVQRHAADDGDGGLAAGVAARAHDHRHAGDQHRGEHVFVGVEDEPRKGGADHEDEQPGDAVEVNFQGARL